MAYGNYIASVPAAEIVALRDGRTSVLNPSCMASVSHLLASWIKVQPLGRLLHEAVDGGRPLAEGFDHPLRRPMVHKPADVRRLLAGLRAELAAVDAGEPVREVDWFRPEIDGLITTFQHAADHGESIVNVLHPPFDDARAAGVRLPLDLDPRHGRP